LCRRSLKTGVVLVGCAKPVSFLDQSWMAANSTISMLAAGRWVARQPASHLASTSPSFALTPRKPFPNSKKRAFRPAPLQSPSESRRNTAALKNGPW